MFHWKICFYIYLTNILYKTFIFYIYKRISTRLHFLDLGAACRKKFQLVSLHTSFDVLLAGSV